MAGVQQGRRWEAVLYNPPWDPYPACLPSLLTAHCFCWGLCFCCCCYWCCHCYCLLPCYPYCFCSCYCLFPLLLLLLLPFCCCCYCFCYGFSLSQAIIPVVNDFPVHKNTRKSLVSGHLLARLLSCLPPT